MKILWSLHWGGCSGWCVRLLNQVIVTVFSCCSYMRHQVFNNEMNREWVFFQGDAGIHGRPGFPGRKGEQVGLISVVEKQASLCVKCICVLLYDHLQACSLCFPGGTWTFWGPRDPREGGTSRSQGTCCITFILYERKLCPDEKCDHLSLSV